MLENWFYKMKPYLVYLFLAYAGFTLALVDISLEASVALAPLVYFAWLGGTRYSDPLNVVFYAYNEEEEAPDIDFICYVIEDVENQPVRLVHLHADDFKGLDEVCEDDEGTDNF